MSHTTIALFRNRDIAERAITSLREIGVKDSDISYVYVTSEGATETKDGSGSSTGGTVADVAVGGAATGAVVGALAGLTVVSGVLPGLGTLLVAGPLAASLGLSGAAATTAAGAMTGAAAGGLIGALAGLGASDEDARMFETRVKEGDVLVVATAERDVKEAFEKHDPAEVREYANG